jgi:hypothetical protein
MNREAFDQDVKNAPYSFGAHEHGLAMLFRQDDRYLVRLFVRVAPFARQESHCMFSQLRGAFLS